jgi:hypothetical protein
MPSVSELAARYDMSFRRRANHVAGMEQGLRAAMPQLDAVLAERSASAAHA